jgi:hypothetical protein
MSVESSVKEVAGSLCLTAYRVPESEGIQCRLLKNFNVPVIQPEKDRGD